MKMIIAITDQNIHDVISDSLLKQTFRVTQLATTTRFLHEGSTTLMIGVEDERVDEALQIIRDSVPQPSDEEKNQVTLYILNVKNFNRL